PIDEGYHDRLEIAVRHDPLGEGRAHARQTRVALGAHRPARPGRVSSSHTMGCPLNTGSPSRTRTPATRASTGDSTLTATLPCSITATGWLGETHSSPSWKRAGGRRRIRPATGATISRNPNPPDSPLVSWSGSCRSETLVGAFMADPPVAGGRAA